MHVRYRRAMAAFVGLGAVGFALTLHAYQPSAIVGDWTVNGSNTVRGAYSGSMRFKERTDGRIAITAALKFANGKKLGWAAVGDLQGDTLKFAGRTSAGIISTIVHVGHASKIQGSYTISSTAKIDGAWTISSDNSTSTDSLERAAPADAGLLTLVDGDGKDVPAADKTKVGVVIDVNIYDEDNNWQDQDGRVDYVPDSQRTNVANERELLPFKLAKPASAPADAQWKLTFPAAKLAVWSTKTKDSGTDVKSGAAFAATDTTLYLEGLAPSDPGAGETLSVDLVSNGSAIASDKGNVRVARTAFLICGHGCSGTYYLDSYLRKNPLDKRQSPTFVMGKGEKGQPVAWAVNIVSDEKSAKMALCTDGACIAYDGHSNFGMGFAFLPAGYTSVSQFMNIANPQQPVNWEYLRDHQDHPNLIFEDSEYGDDASTPEFSDPVQIPFTAVGTLGSYSSTRFPESGGNGTRLHLTRGAVKWQDNHYGQPGNLRIVIKAGAKDMPAKKWDKLYLNSCYSGQYYIDSFGGRGVLFFTHEESSSAETSALFLEGCIEGKTNDQIRDGLNKAENINDYHAF